MITTMLLGVLALPVILAILSTLGYWSLYFIYDRPDKNIRTWDDKLNDWVAGRREPWKWSEVGWYTVVGFGTVCFVVILLGVIYSLGLYIKLWI